MFRIFVFLGLILASLTVPAAATTWENQPIPGGFGVNTHGVLSDDALRLMHKGGFRWIRSDLFWDEVEIVRGVYDFRASDEKFMPMLKAGFRLMLILDYGNKLYGGERSPNTPEARAAFARFAVEAVKHYAGHNIVWEIYNEPNIPLFWQPEPNVDDYIALAAEATAALRQIDSNAIVVGPAISGPISEGKSAARKKAMEAFMKSIFESEVVQQWNAITVHPYRVRTEGPETSGKQLDRLRAMMAEAGLDPNTKPIIAAEWGYSTFTKGVEEPKQAAYAAREILWSMVQGMPFTIWYDWQDDGDDAEEKEHRFGLLRRGDKLDPKPAYYAVAQLAQQLDGYQFENAATDANGVITARFSKEGKKAFVIWSSDDNPHDLVVSLPPGQWLANTILLATTKPVFVQNGETLSAHAMPTLITSP